MNAPVLILIASVLSQVEPVIDLGQNGVGVLRGTVVDASGEPVDGARVDIATAAPKTGPAMFCPSCYRDCAKWTSSDVAGRFEFRGLDPALKFRLLVAGPEYQTHSTQLIDPSREQVTITLDPWPADVSHDRIIRGIVTSVDGRPIAGALIEPEGAKTPGRRWGGRVTGATPTVSDDQGRFRMLLTEAYLGVDVDVSAAGYAGTDVALLKPGDIEHEIIVPRGTKVTGRLTIDGEPAARAAVAVVQTDRSVTNDRGQPNHFIKAVQSETDAEGRFTFESLPADQQYAIFTPVATNDSRLVLPTTLFNAAKDDESRDVGSLELVEGLSLSGRVEMADGSPLPDETALALGRDPAWDLIKVPVADDGNFHIDALPPESYTVRIANRDLVIDATQLAYQQLGPTSFGVRVDAPIENLNFKVTQAGNDESSLGESSTGPVSDSADATQSLAGCVVDPHGQPIEDVTVTVRAVDWRGFVQGDSQRQAWMETRRDGTFSFEGLSRIPVRLMAYRPNPAGGRIHYPAELQPRLDQQDIRIVIDPTLHRSLRDLDHSSLAN